MFPQKVIFDHDGGVDDLLSLMLLLTMPDVDVLAVTITPADCYLSDATLSTLKILQMFGRHDIPVGQGNIHGINAFPAEWRAQPKICNALPDMLSQAIDVNQISPLSAAQLIANRLEEHDQTTILMTGPCSNLIAAMELNQQIKSHIDQVIWMGGAVSVGGNVAMHNHDKSAEWNAFWDPVATRSLIRSGIKLKLIGLDATNCLPVNTEFLSTLAKQKEYSLSHLAGQFWATTINSIPSYEYTYFMWDVLATAMLALPSDASSFISMELDVSIDEPNAGQTLPAPGSGHWVDVASWVDREQVLNYVLAQFKRQIPVL